MFTTSVVPLFIFTTNKKIFSKKHCSLNGKRLLCNCYIYIINNYLNKKMIFYVFE